MNEIRNVAKFSRNVKESYSDIAIHMLKKCPNQKATFDFLLFKSDLKFDLFLIVNLYLKKINIY